jgi:hypothetical protein
MFIVDVVSQKLNLHRHVADSVCRLFNMNPYEEATDDIHSNVDCLVDVSSTSGLSRTIGEDLTDLNLELSQDCFFYKPKAASVADCILSKTKKGNCGICLESGDMTLSKCNHTFHEHCLSKWVENCVANCPMCRYEFKSTEK